MYRPENQPQKPLQFLKGSFKILIMLIKLLIKSFGTSCYTNIKDVANATTRFPSQNVKNGNKNWPLLISFTRCESLSLVEIRVYNEVGLTK